MGSDVVGLLPVASNSVRFHASVVLQRFFTLASVRPGRSRAMAVHLFPYLAWAAMMILSSSAVNGRCSTSGLRHFNHRTRHELLDLPGMPALTTFQLLVPCWPTSLVSSSSSSELHGLLIIRSLLSFSRWSPPPPATGTSSYPCRSMRSDVVGSPAAASESSVHHSLARVVYQRYTTATLVRAGRSRAMAAHLFPYLAWAAMMVSSSSAVNGRRSTSGCRCLSHRCRHARGFLSGMPALMKFQLLVPSWPTSLVRSSSSSELHGLLIAGCCPSCSASSISCSTKCHCELFHRIPNPARASNDGHLVGLMNLLMRVDFWAVALPISTKSGHCECSMSAWLIVSGKI